MKPAITVSKEDYLKAILEAESEGRTVIAATLVHWLSVSPPAVSMALRRLRRDGFVEVDDDGVLRLTPAGREAAYRTALRHYLIERMLAEVFGMPWYQVHDEAERLEHAVSPAFEALLIKKLGEEGACPHGNFVLPESPEQRRHRGLIPLSDAPEGSHCTVGSFFERDPELLHFLHRSGIEPGGEVRVLHRRPDRSLQVETYAGRSTVAVAAAEKVQVTCLAGSTSGAASHTAPPHESRPKPRQTRSAGRSGI
jgi:DtxR family Mn-dependent transcriptional regulator